MTRPTIDTASCFEIQEINQKSDFLSLRTEWNQLLAESDSDILFLRHEWLSCWWQHFAQNSAPSELLVLLVRSQTGELCAIAPFKLARHNLFGFRLKVIGFLGEGASDYSDLIVHRNANHMLVIGALSDYLQQQAARWDLLDFRNLYADTQTRSLCLQEAQRRGWRSTASDEGFCRYIPIEGDWEAYYSERVSSAGRSAHRKEWRRLNNVGASDVRIIRSVPDLHGFLEQLAEVESQHPDSANSRPGFLRTQPFRAFLEQFLADAEPNHWLSVAVLECDQVIVAYYLSFFYQQRYYCYLTSYRNDFRRHGVGRLTFIRMLEQFWNSGAEQIDLLRGEEEYKLNWSEVGRQNRRLLLVNPGGWAMLNHWVWWRVLPVIEQRLPRVFHAYVLLNAEGMKSLRLWVTKRLRAQFAKHSRTG